VTTLHDGLDSVGDVALDPRTGTPAAASMGQFDPVASLYVPGTGAVLAFDGPTPTPLADGFSGVVAMTYAPDGTVFFAELYSDDVYTVAPRPVANEPEAAPSGRSVLHGGAPNPFVTATTIPFDLPRASSVHLAVYDVLGREVALLADGFFLAGRHEAAWDGRDAAGRAVPAGRYLLRLDAGGAVQARAVTRVR
jgi:hypothetical protein